MGYQPHAEEWPEQCTAHLCSSIQRDGQQRQVCNLVPWDDQNCDLRASAIWLCPRCVLNSQSTAGSINCCENAFNMSALLEFNSQRQPKEIGHGSALICDGRLLFARTWIVCSAVKQLSMIDQSQDLCMKAAR